MEIHLIEKYLKDVCVLFKRGAIEAYVLSSFEDLKSNQNQNEFTLTFKMKFNKLWLNHLGEISSSCLISIMDSGALPILLLFSTRQSTSVNLKLSMINPRLSGDYLYFTSNVVKQDSAFNQINFTVRDDEKLIATGTHFKIFLPLEVPKI